MKYTCMFCKGKGTQASGLICISCRGRGSFDIAEKTTSCNSCKGTGRATIKTLACITCGGKGFLINAGEIKGEEKKTKQTIERESETGELREAPTELFKEKKASADERLSGKEALVPTSQNKKKSVGRKRPVITEEFGEENLDSLKKSLTDILDSPFLS